MSGKAHRGAQKRTREFDAVVVGSGPNGLAAAIRLAQAGLRTHVLEARDSPGGGARTAALTLPDFRHDVCSAIHPLAVDSPFFASLPLADYGLEWIVPDAALAHPFDDGSAAVLMQSLDDTAASLGEDGEAYRRVFARLSNDWASLRRDILAPPHFPRHAFRLARFGMLACQSAAGLCRRRFTGPRARGAFAGLAAHSFLPMEQVPSAAFGLILGLLCHRNGWPFPKGGAQSLVDALLGYFYSLGGTISLNTRVRRFDALPEADLYLLDVSTSDAVTILGDRLPSRYRRQLLRHRYGPGVFKIDWALNGPIPFASTACRRAGTIHLGGTLEEIAAAERSVARGKHPKRPFVLLSSQSAFDPTRAPSGHYTGWAYTHVPPGSTVDRTAAIEAQVERFAPGFKDTILARHTMNTRDYESYNPNCVGGDINGGLANLRQLFFRPRLTLRPYHTPVKGVYLCSAATPPGGGVHGMCGYWAAEAALSDIGLSLGTKPVDQ